METEPETLVILSPGFPENEADTVCIPAQQLFVKALKEVCPGLNVIVIAFEYPHFSGEYEWNGVKVISIGGKNKGKLFRLRTWLLVWQALRKLNKMHRLMGILSFWFGECAFIGSYFAKQNKLLHYSWILGQDAKKGNNYFSLVKPGGDSLIALSDFTAKEIKANYKVSPMQVIPVGVDTSLFDIPPLKRDIDVIGVGSLIPLKQYHLFVETIVFLKRLLPGIKAVICGKGPEMGYLQTLVASMNLEENILFTGELPHREVLALMQRSKVFLHPSNYEGFGAVLSEALYSGAHVVSFCKPMTKEFRHHHVVKNTEEMKAEVLALLQTKKLDHLPVLAYPIQQVAKNMISLFAG
jgi:glycosyltransferase involved in cell wall biosynthesis